MKIRPYHPNDERRLVQLWIDCGLVVPHNHPIRDIQRKLDENPDWLLVGEKDGRLIASCMLGYDGHRGWIYYLAVAPEERNNGYARQMLSKAEQLLADAGCLKYQLMIRESNARVISFYERLGFTRHPVVCMSKRLADDEPHDHV